jgi:hypothetical protein
VLGLRGGDDTPVSRGHRRPGPRSASPEAAGPNAPLPPPVQRAVNREPVIEEEWPYDDELSYKMIPVPGGCIVVGTPRGRRR